MLPFRPGQELRSRVRIPSQWFDVQRLERSPASGGYGAQKKLKLKRSADRGRPGTQWVDQLRVSHPIRYFATFYLSLLCVCTPEARLANFPYRAEAITLV